MSDRVNGRIRWFNEDRGFGFVSGSPDGQDAFFHVNTCDLPMADIAHDAHVSFIPEQGEKGLKAVQMRLAEGTPTEELQDVTVPSEELGDHLVKQPEELTHKTLLLFETRPVMGESLKIKMRALLHKCVMEFVDVEEAANVEFTSAYEVPNDSMFVLVVRSTGPLADAGEALEGCPRYMEWWKDVLTVVRHGPVPLDTVVEAVDEFGVPL